MAVKKFNYWRAPSFEALIEGAAVVMRPRSWAWRSAASSCFLRCQVSSGSSAVASSWTCPAPACRLLPSYDGAAYLTGLAVMSAGYAALHWATLNYGLSLRRPWLSVHATTPFGLVSGFLLGRTWTLSFTETGRLTGFGELVWVFTVPATLWLLGVHFRWWARAKARYWSDGDERIEHIVRMLVCWYVGIAAAVKVRVRCREGHIAVTAPVDAVDARRIEDIVMTRFPSRFTVGVQTTLPADVYWAVYRSELGPSGYVSPPIRPPWLCRCPLWQARHSRRRDHRIRLLARSGLAPGIGPEDLGASSASRLLNASEARRGEMGKSGAGYRGTRSASFKPLGGR